MNKRLLVNKDVSFCSEINCKLSHFCLWHICNYPQWKDENLSYMVIENVDLCRWYSSINVHKQLKDFTGGKANV